MVHYYLIESMNVAAMIYLALGVYALTRAPNIANRLFFLCMFISAGWAFDYYHELTALTFDKKVLWMQGRFFFLPFLVVLWLMLTAELAGIRKRIPHAVWALLFVVPFITVPIAMTMNSHDLFRHHFSLASANPHMQPILFLRGPWYIFYESYSSILQAVSLGILVWASRHATPPLRTPMILLTVSSCLPIISNLVFSVNTKVAGGFSPAPMLLFPAACAMALAVFRSQLLNVLPIARELLFDAIHEGIVVSNDLGYIVDMNTAAITMLGSHAADLRNHTREAVPKPWFDALDPSGDETLVFCNDMQRGGPWFERKRIPIVKDIKSRGWMFVLQDITARITLQQQSISEIRSQEEAKRAQQWAMLLRDLHDGIGSVSANIGLLAALALKTPTPGEKNKLIAQISDLANEGNIEVRTMMNSLENRNLSWRDLFIEIRQFASLMLEPRGIQFYLTVSGMTGSDLGIGIGTSIFRVVKEAVTNAAKHAHPTRVSVEFNFGEDAITLVIKDDGNWRAVGHEGRGLRHMRQRIHDLGGSFNLETQPATCLTCVLPIKLPNIAM